MLSQAVEDALNKQIQKELYSANLYLAMSAWLASIDMPGASNWMKVQYKEELMHMEKIFDYIIERDGVPVVSSVDEPQHKWDLVLDVFMDAYKHEQFITQSIGEVLQVARAENDYATEIFLQWFISEQVEEEANFKGIIQQLKMLDNTQHGLYMLDKELASRMLVPSQSTNA